MKPGEWYSRKKLYDGFRITQEIYGRGGYMEWTPAPMFKYSDDPDPIEQALTAAGAADAARAATSRRRPA